MDVSKVRKSLGAFNFDSVNYINNELLNINSNATDAEQQIFNMFNGITTNLTTISESIEDEVAILQDTASMTENVLLDHLELNSEKLTAIDKKVTEVQTVYNNASEGAVRIGSKLATSERERLRILNAIDLLEFVRFYQEECEDMTLNESDLTTNSLTQYLPYRLQSENWGVISRVSTVLVVEAVLMVFMGHDVVVWCCSPHSFV